MEPEGDASLDVFSDWPDALSLPTIKKKNNNCEIILKRMLQI